MPAQQHHHGEDGWSKLSAYLDSMHANNVLLVTGNAMYGACGAEENLRPILSGRKASHLSCPHPNPCVEDVTRLFAGLDGRASYQAILAVGGGSVIDVAKLLKAFWSDPGHVDEYFSKRNQKALSPGALPLIAMPTTAGSGSEATRFAVVYKDKEKCSVEHDRLLPDCAIVIPSLLQSVPTRVAASSGVDALCQAIESYWSIHSTDESRQWAREAITLAWRWLEEAVRQRSPQALDQMATASHLAGQAINLTKTTAPHAVSYRMTSCFGITHGHAVGLLTTRFLEFNAGVGEEDCLDPRGPAWVRQRLDEIAAMLDADTVQGAAQALTKKLNDLGLETSLAELGIHGEQDLEVIIGSGFDPGRLNNNPRAVDPNAIRWLLRQVS